MPPEALRDTLSEQADVQEAFRSSPWAAGYPRGMYRNQWWVMVPERGLFWASGIHGQLLWIDQSADLVVAKLSTWPLPLDTELRQLTLTACDRIAAALTGKSD